MTTLLETRKSDQYVNASFIYAPRTLSEPNTFNAAFTSHLGEHAM